MTGLETLHRTIQIIYVTSVFGVWVGTLRPNGGRLIYQASVTSNRLLSLPGYQAPCFFNTSIYSFRLTGSHLQIARQIKMPGHNIPHLNNLLS